MPHRRPHCKAEAVSKLRLATVSLAGCFGCHMSLLDIDERLIELAGQIEVVRSPLIDGDDGGAIDVCLVEGGLCNADNVRVAQELRARSKLLIEIGACAIYGGIPALRNRFPLDACFREAYGERAPDSTELPRILETVRPLREAVAVDFSIPGCPPPAEALLTILQQALAGQPLNLPEELVRYD